MEKSKRKHGDRTPVQVFRPNIMARFGFAFVLFFLTGHFLFMTYALRQSGQSESLWLFAVMIPLYGMLFFYTLLSRSQQLVIYEEGLEQRYGSRRSFIPWENLSHFEFRSQGKSSYTGIVTRRKIQDEVAGGAIERFLHSRGDDHFLVLSSVVNVPKRYRKWLRFEVDTDKLRRTDFGKVLSEYAPHLFEKDK